MYKIKIFFFLIIKKVGIVKNLEIATVQHI